MGKEQTLLQVREAEKKARDLILDAEEKQKSIVAAAHRDAAAKVQEAERELKMKRDSVLVNEEKELALEKEAQIAKGKDEANTIKVKANERVPKAKTYIKEHFERTLDVATGSNE